MTTAHETSPIVTERVQHAKEPLSPVAGPYGHPFHPILVTIPIGAWVSSLVFDIAGMMSEEVTRAYFLGARWLIGIGIIAAIVAAVFGLMDYTRVSPRTAAKRSALTHMSLNVLVLAMFVVGYLWRDSTEPAPLEASTGQLILTLAALVVLGVSGWIGGMLAYRYGVRVASERDQGRGYIDLR